MSRASRFQLLGPMALPLTPCDPSPYSLRTACLYAVDFRLGECVRRFFMVLHIFSRNRFILYALMAWSVVGMSASGCKTGTTSANKSWWPLTGTSNAEKEKLATAPLFEANPKKPSESATPYPTTSTPNGYVVTDTPDASTKAKEKSEVALISTPQRPITYGSSPSTTASHLESKPASITTGLGPQVGPYASKPLDSPLANPGASSPSGSFSQSPSAPPRPSSGFGSSIGSSEFASPAASPSEALMSGGAAGSTAPPAARMADTRYPDPVGNGSRYSSGSPSRFGSAEDASATRSPAQEYPAAQASTATPPLQGLSPNPSAIAQPPYGTGSISPAATNPRAFESPAPAADAPRQKEASGNSPGVPTRRADPGYRPGGTSSYKPTRSLLVDESQPPPSGVRTVSFETPLRPQ